METGEGGSAIAHLDGDSELSSSPVPKLDSTPHERPSVSAPAVPVPRSDPTAIASNGYNDLASSDAVEDRETTGVPPIDREMSAVTGNDGAAAAPLQAIPRFARRPTEGVSATSPATGAIESRRRKHRIADGDTLPSIAQRYLRDPSRWTEIYSLNRDLLDNPELLPIGAEIRLPEKQSQHPIGGEMQAASPSASASSGLVESDNRPSYEASEPLAPIPSGLFKSNPSPPEDPFTGNDDVKDDLSTSAAPSHVKPAEAKSDQSSGESTASTVDPK